MRVTFRCSAGPTTAPVETYVTFFHCDDLGDAKDLFTKVFSYRPSDGQVVEVARDE